MDGGTNRNIAFEQHHKSRVSIQYDLEVKEWCPFCGEVIRGYISCEQGIIQRVHFRPCGCTHSSELFKLTPLFEG